MIFIFALLNVVARAQVIQTSSLSPATRAALKRQDLRTFHEVALAAEDELFDVVLNRRQFNEVRELLTYAGLAFGKSPFKELKLGDRVALHRLGLDSLAAYFENSMMVRQVLDEDQLMPYWATWKLRMITENRRPPGDRAHRLFEEIDARLKELDALVEKNGLEVLPFDDEALHLVKEIRRRERLMARCERTMILSR